MITEKEIAGQQCFVKRCHPESGHRDIFYFYGFICPFCGSEKYFLLEIVEEIDLKTRKLDGYEVRFSCSDFMIPCDQVAQNCARSVGLAFYGAGVPLEDIYKYTVEDYKSWKCNKKKGKRNE